MTSDAENKKKLHPAISAGIYISLFAVMVALSANLTGRIGFIFGGISIILTSLLLFLIFSSILSRGVESAGSAVKIAIISLAGILMLPMHFAVMYLHLGILDPGGSRVDSIWTAYYYSVVTWTTLGYGDFIPAPDARWLVIIEVSLGYVLMALLIASFVRAMSSR